MLAKSYGFLFFSKKMTKTIVKNQSKKLSRKFIQKILNHAKQFPTNAIKNTSKRII